uniref:Uncharacterized protein n=1 Tax=Anguilla anguilla TaxID=7936 RepID=A0A0E9V1A5_ANGAN
MVPFQVVAGERSHLWTL